MPDWTPDGWTASTLAYAAGVFVIAGLVKGIAGTGLPTVALALMVLAIDLKQAIALLVLPTLMTNVWQAVAGDALRTLSRRLAPLLAAAALGIWAGVTVLAAGDTRLLSGILGIVLAGYAAFSLATPQVPPPPPRAERWLGPAMGAASGLLFGITGSFLVPVVPYLQALGLGRDGFVQATGIALSFATLVLWALLAWNGLFALEVGILSLAVCVPALIGMAAGQALRRRLSEALFRKVFFAALLAIALYIALRAFS